LRLKILKKLRTASLNSEFAGSYKKSVLFLIKWRPFSIFIRVRVRAAYLSSVASDNELGSK